MSLKFGIYLVEQRIITPEQLCGLIKIQQEGTTSLGTIALRKNLMTIRQVANVLEAQEKANGKSFEQIVLERKYLRHTEVEYLQQIQQATCQPIRSLVVECGLLTKEQTMVLFQHHEKMVAHQRAVADLAVAHNKLRPSKGGTQTAASKEAQAKPAASATKPAAPRQPNFKRRPMIIETGTGVN